MVATERIRDIVIAWNDAPDTHLGVTVALGLDEVEHDDFIFWYFSDEAEMLDAMNGGSALDFRVVSI